MMRHQQNNHRRKILVVGGAGYIGSHTAKVLARLGYLPVILDDFSTGHREAARLASPDSPICEGSYADIALVESVLKKHNIDTVFHFGSKALVGESIENPLLYYSANTGGTVNLLQAMRNAGANNLVFSSTCATFGEPSEVPIHEGVEQNPVNPYGQSKLMVERILKDMRALHGMNSVILRYFNAAGADPQGALGEDHAPETHLIPRALRVALGQDPKLTINGKDYPTRDGSCVRDYVHVNDLAMAHIQAMEFMWQQNSSFDFNLGTENGYSVFEVVEMINTVTGKKISTEIGPRRAGDPPVLVADAGKARTILGWKPEFDLKSIVETAYQWTRNHPNGYDKK